MSDSVQWKVLWHILCVLVGWHLSAIISFHVELDPTIMFLTMVVLYYIQLCNLIHIFQWKNYTMFDFLICSFSWNDRIKHYQYIFSKNRQSQVRTKNAKLTTKSPFWMRYLVTFFALSLCYSILFWKSGTVRFFGRVHILFIYSCMSFLGPVHTRLNLIQIKLILIN